MWYSGTSPDHTFSALSYHPLTQPMSLIGPHLLSSPLFYSPKSTHEENHDVCSSYPGLFCLTWWSSVPSSCFMAEYTSSSWPLATFSFHHGLPQVTPSLCGPLLVMNSTYHIPKQNLIFLLCCHPKEKGVPNKEFLTMALCQNHRAGFTTLTRIRH